MFAVGVVRLTLLALFNGSIFADLVGDGSATCSYGSADECAFASSGEAADDGSASGRATHDLGSGVVAMILLGLLAFRAVVCGLRDVVENRVVLGRE
jgi:hypothetical protein